MSRISTQGLINSLRKCANGQDCKWCAFDGSADCIKKLTSTAANRIEELQVKRRKQNAKINGKKQHRRGIYR